MNAHEFAIYVRKEIAKEADKLAMRNGESLSVTPEQQRAAAGRVLGLRDAIKIINKAIKGGEDFPME